MKIGRHEFEPANNEQIAEMKEWVRDDPYGEYPTGDVVGPLLALIELQDQIIVDQDNQLENAREIIRTMFRMVGSPPHLGENAIIDAKIRGESHVQEVPPSA